MKRACVFAHYDADGEVDATTLYYLSRLAPHIEKIHFISTSPVTETAQRQLSELGVFVSERDNVGYDFLSYRLGLEQIDAGTFDEVLLCNNSVYGPLVELSGVFERMAAEPCDFWGITDSQEIAYHLQSYFLVFRPRALASDAFATFWRDVEALSDKNEIIRRYEVGLTRQLMDAGLQPGAVISVRGVQPAARLLGSAPQFLARFKQRWREPGLYRHLLQVLTGRQRLQVNPVQMEWRRLLTEQSLPFIKIELLRDNPLGVGDEVSALEYIAESTDYPVPLIEAHLARVRR